MLFAFFSLPYACHGEAKRSCLFYCTLSNKVKLINIQIFSFFFFREMAIYEVHEKEMVFDLSDGFAGVFADTNEQRRCCADAFCTLAAEMFVLF